MLFRSPLDKAAGKVQKGLRVFLRDPAPLPAVSARLKSGGEGDVSLVLMVEAGKREVEVRLPGRYVVSGAIAGALKAVPGVVAVEHV